MVDGTPALVASELGKRYGRRWALRDVDLTVPSGRVVALVGDNGAGKTTLLHLAVGLLRPDVGGLTVLGRRPGPESLGDIGFLAQEKPLYRDFRVRDLVKLGRRLNRRWDGAYVASRLSHLDIPLNRRAGELSGGQRAQVSLTLALGKRPRLLLLDEPVANLDPLARRQFMAAVAAEVAESGTTVVHSSHDLAELNRACDHVIIMRRGSIILSGDVGEVVPDGVPLEDAILDRMTASVTA